MLHPTKAGQIAAGLSTKPPSTRFGTSAQAHLRQMPRQWAADSPSLLQAATSGQATNSIYRHQWSSNKQHPPQKDPAPTGLRVQTMGSTALQDSQPNSARASVKTHRVQAEAPSQAPETCQHAVQGYMQRSRSHVHPRGKQYLPWNAPGQTTTTTSTVEPQGAHATGPREHKQLGDMPTRGQQLANKRRQQALLVHGIRQNWSEEATGRLRAHTVQSAATMLAGRRYATQKRKRDRTHRQGC